jgi:hypothetical protein
MSDYVVIRVHKRALAILLAPAALLAVAVPGTLFAGAVGTLNVFSNGTVADADAVNVNFEAVRVAVDDNAARIDALESSSGGGGAGDLQIVDGAYRWADGTLASSCAEYSTAAPDQCLVGVPDGLYEIALSGGSKVVWCDMATDGGGWTLVARIRGNSAAHYQTGASGTVDDPEGSVAGKWSDAEINELRGDYSQSVVRFECGSRKVFFQENKDFVATGAGGSSLNRCAPTWDPASWSDATGYFAHYGAQTWQASTCPYMIYY